MKFVIATNNPGKMREFRAILNTPDISCISLVEAGVRQSPEETGVTFEENARIKARAACTACGLPSIADDSGIMCDALDGAPGIYSARFGGPGLNDWQRLQHLLDVMREVPDAQRGVTYHCAIVCVLPDGREFVTQGECRGVLLRTPAGDNGFGHDPAFYLPEYGQTFAQLSQETKNRISHRAIALRQLVAVLREQGIYG